MVDVQESVGGGESGLLEPGVGLAGDERVEVVEGPGVLGLGPDVLESGDLLLLVDGDQILAVLDLNAPLLELLLDPGVGRVEVLHELVVGVDDGEGVLWRELAVRAVPFPDLRIKGQGLLIRK